jgi:hypothetical protein
MCAGSLSAVHIGIEAIAAPPADLAAIDAQLETRRIFEAPPAASSTAWTKDAIGL